MGADPAGAPRSLREAAPLAESAAQRAAIEVFDVPGELAAT